MAVSGITTNYTGRTKDLFISQGINPSLATTQQVNYGFGRLSYVVTGVQKLVQRYLITLFNAGLISRLNEVAGAGIGEIPPTFALLNGPIVNDFRAYQAQNSSIPADEQLNTVSLTDYGVKGDSIYLSLALLTNAGDNVTFVLPVSII